MKRIALISFLVFFYMFCKGTYSQGYELEKIFDDTREICCPLGLADVNNDGAAEWIYLKSKYVEHRPKAEKRMYVYKFNKVNKKIETLWESPDISSKDYLEGFGGKIYFGDLDGNGIKEIILIGWRFRADEETRGYPYEGNIYVFGWNGKKFVQRAKTADYFFSELTRPEQFAIVDVFGTGKDVLITEEYEKLVLLEVEEQRFKERILTTQKRPLMIRFRVGDIDYDGKNEIIMLTGEYNEPTLNIVKYDGTEFKTIYKKTFPKTDIEYVTMNEIRETLNGYKVVSIENYRGSNKRHFRFIPKTEEYPGETEEEKENKLKEIEVKNPVFKEESAKYPGLSLPKGRHHFADIDGDGRDELINCGPKGVSIYKIK